MANGRITDNRITTRTILIIQGFCILLLCGALVVQGVEIHNWQRASCNSRKINLSVLHDVVVIAFTPPKGSKPLNPAQVRAITTTEGAIFTRINQAEC